MTRPFCSVVRSNAASPSGTVDRNDIAMSSVILLVFYVADDPSSQQISNIISRFAPVPSNHRSAITLIELASLPLYSIRRTGVRQATSRIQLRVNFYCCSRTDTNFVIWRVRGDTLGKRRSLHTYLAFDLHVRDCTVLATFYMMHWAATGFPAQRHAATDGYLSHQGWSPHLSFDPASCKRSRWIEFSQPRKRKL